MTIAEQTAKQASKERFELLLTTIDRAMTAYVEEQLTSKKTFAEINEALRQQRFGLNDFNQEILEELLGRIVERAMKQTVNQ